MAIFTRPGVLPLSVIRPTIWCRQFGFIKHPSIRDWYSSTTTASVPLCPSSLVSCITASPHRLYSSESNTGPDRHEYKSDRMFHKLLLAAGITALVGGSVVLRWYVNREPSYAGLVKEARGKLQTSTSPGKLDSVSLELETDGKSPISVEMQQVPEQITPLDQSYIQSGDNSTDAHSPHTISTEPVDPEHAPTTTTGLDQLETDDLPPLEYINPDKAGFPSHVRYLVVGCGTAGLAAARSIRAADPQSRVLMIAGGTGPSDYAEPGLPETNHVEPPPYLRPPLSKELWRRTKEREARVLQPTGDIRRHSWLYYEAESFFLKPEELNTVEYGGVSLVRGDPVVRLDPDRHVATLASGRQITYERCLLATGGRPKRLLQLEKCARTGDDLRQTGHVSYFRTLADYRRLREVCDRLKKSHGTVAVIGGGFLGCELAVSLLSEPDQPHTELQNKDGTDTSSSSKLKVMHVFRESAPLGQVLPPCLAAATARYEASCGTELWASSELVSVSLVPSPVPTAIHEPDSGKRAFANPLQTVTASHTASPSRIRLRIRRSESGKTKVEDVEVDHLVCAIGIEPNTDLAASAGLEVDQVHGGFLANAELETRAGVYVAGDAASYWDPVLGFRRRVEHLNFAEETGTLAGKNMAAACLKSDNADSSTPPHRYHYQSSLWSTLGPNLSWDAIGNVDARHLNTRSFFLSESTNPDKSSGQADVLHSLPTADFGRLGRGVVFYLTPKEKRLVGILLWNLPDELYTDPKYAAPSRLNLARSLLAERRIVGQDPAFDSEEAELRELATMFDLSGELENDYAELKAYIESQKAESESEATTEPIPDKPDVTESK